MYEMKWGAEVNCSPKSRCKYLLEIFSVIRNITLASSSVVTASTSVISYKTLMVTFKKGMADSEFFRNTTFVASIAGCKIPTPPSIRCAAIWI